MLPGVASHAKLQSCHRHAPFGSTTAGLHSLWPVKLRPTSVVAPAPDHDLPRIV